MNMKMSFHEKEWRHIRTLRSWYRRNYENGHSDECFMLWLERKLQQEAEAEEQHDEQRRER